MAITIISYAVADELRDLRYRLEFARDELQSKPRLAAKLTTALREIEDVEDALADGPAGEPGK